MSQPFRLATGGRIDRSRRLKFRFDGETYYGHPGDTLASALLANCIRLVGRSFKYHRPRGFLSAGPEEPNAIVELRSGARREPNTRATMAELFGGLEARSQNRFPSLHLDLLAINQLFSPIFVGGFYYKTFMWPASWWESVYEKLIRRAAGLGRAAPAPDPDHYQHAHLHCDVLVVGAGPAGLMAALAAGRTGARVALAEQAPDLGGALLQDEERIDGQPASAWLASIEAELADQPELVVMRRTTVFGYYDHNVLGAVERVTDHLPVPPRGQPRQRLWTIRAKEVVLATGAIERPVVFGDNDRPGVMLASAVRRYVNQFAVAPGRRAVVATNNDDAYRTALDLVAAGIEVPVIADARAEPGAAAEAARGAGIQVWHGTVPLRAHGGRRLRAVELDGAFKAPVHCDLLAVSGGYGPAVHLASQSGAKPVWDETLHAFLPGQPVQQERSVGSAAGTYDLAGCLCQGAEAGSAAADRLGFAADPPPLPVTEPRAETPLEPLWRVKGPGKAFVDLQNDVTDKDIEIAASEGYRSVEHVKRYTTLSMATDQGKTSSVTGMAILAEARGDSIPTVGTTTFRPPYTPVAIGAFAGHERGKSFQPTRRTAVHAWHRRAGAVFVEAGQWLRPQYYPRHRSGGGLEDIMQACTREAAQVRASVGLCDVSTLGKIELFGSDAGEFLNRLYINGFAKLPVGRARYGIMLREDGHVLDDGTTSRLADDHYLMTTTTANAARVLAHMEHYHQCVWPELDVAFCSATEQWCGIAVAGPNARRVLEQVVDDADVSNDALPFMGVIDATSGGVPIRIFRISFSGELGFELQTGWGHGETLWERLMQAGAPFGIAPYGTEALSILRIEKGHVAGNEIDGRTTATDLGLGRMASTKKRYIGQEMAGRSGMTDPDRPAFVGLRPVSEDGRLRGGAHLVDDPATATGESSQGWISSVHESPHQGSWIGLGFIKGGLSRQGEIVTAYYPLKNEAVPVEIVHPCFIDPDGERLRA